MDVMGLAAAMTIGGVIGGVMVLVLYAFAVLARRALDRQRGDQK